MIPTYRNFFRLAALLVAVCVAQVYVFAAPVVTPQAGGTLKTTDNKPVIVNGNRAAGGTTILPNTSIQTPAGVGATVQLGFAEVSMRPGSDIVLDFTPDKDVTVTLKHGCVSITTVGDAQGMIIRPDGTNVATGTGHVANACDQATTTTPPVATTGGGGINSFGLAVLFVAAGAAAVAALTLASRGFNPSPSNP